MQKGLFLFNGNIYTMSARQPKAQAVLIADDKILAVGNNSELENLLTNHNQRLVKWRKINLLGKTVLPGFIDCHTHLFNYGLSLCTVDLTGLTSISQISKRIKKFASKAIVSDEWFLGRGWDKNLLKEGEFLHKKSLDWILPHNPCALFSKDGHFVWVNSKALEKAGIKRETPNPKGGEIERDERGNLTGILKEKAAEDFKKVVEKPKGEKAKKIIHRAVRELQKLGATSIHNAEEIEIFSLLQDSQPLNIRIWAMLPLEKLDSAIALGLKTNFGNEFLRIGAIKIFLDGTLGSQTAWMLEPYEGERENFGINWLNEKELTEVVKKANKNGLSVAIHAIGDRANQVALNALSKGNSGLRNRIEHVQLLLPDDFKRFATLSVIASMQPIHCSSDIEIARKYWGKRASFAYAWKTLLKSGARICFGSDSPIESPNPLKGIYAAITRKRKEDKESFYHKECLNVLEAVHSYTLGAAYASGEERIKGSIEPSKLADLIILSQDIFKIPAEEILETKVETTIFNGEIKNT